jgi:hypothetical protein
MGSKPGKDPDKDQSKRGHRGTNDADIDFDCRPKRDGVIVIRGVAGLGKHNQGLKSDDGDNRDAAWVSICVKICRQGLIGTYNVPTPNINATPIFFFQ